MPLPKYRQKISKLFFQVEDESLRTIISEVISLENEYRTTSNFPIRKIEAIIDNEAKLIELRKSNNWRDDEI